VIVRLSYHIWATLVLFFVVVFRRVFQSFKKSFLYVIDSYERHAMRVSLYGTRFIGTHTL